MTRAFRLGLFIVAPLLVLVAGVLLIGNSQLRFQPTYRVKADFQNVEGLSEGSDVRVGGIHKGSVKADRLAAPARRQGNSGDGSGNSDTGQRLEDGDTIGSEPPMDISDLIRRPTRSWIQPRERCRTSKARRVT